MTSEFNYPFHLINSFFILLDFQREPAVTPGVALTITAEVKVVIENYPKQLQVNLNISSLKDAPIRFHLELVGLFDYSGNNPDIDKYQIVEFLNNQGLFALWPHITQMTRFITSQMGIEVINLNIPLKFLLNPDLLKFDGPSQTENIGDK
jgi:hypothetical protein